MSKLIIDVSYHNGVINWERVKASGCAGAILRCGYGDNIASQDDKQWIRNLAECERLGIPVGVYLYSYATCDRQAQSELDHILRLIKGHTFQLPIFIDVEEPGTQNYAPRCCEIVCEGLKANGYTPGIYASLSWFSNHLGSVRGKYIEWMARYKNLPEDTYKGQYAIWQYASDGQVDGVSGRVDVNHCYMEFGGTVQPVTPSAPSKPMEKKDLGHVDITYQAYTTKWWPAVTNKADWAGKGDNVPIKWLAIKVSKGSIRCRVYTRKNGWLPYLTFGNSYNLNNKVNGILGDGSEILAVELYYITPEGYKYKMVHYRVSVQNNKNFYADQVDTLKASGMDGFAGDKYRFIDKFQAWIE